LASSVVLIICSDPMIGDGDKTNRRSKQKQKAGNSFFS